MQKENVKLRKDKCINKWNRGKKERKAHTKVEGQQK